MRLGLRRLSTRYASSLRVAQPHFRPPPSSAILLSGVVAEILPSANERSVAEAQLQTLKEHLERYGTIITAARTFTECLYPF